MGCSLSLRGVSRAMSQNNTGRRAGMPERKRNEIAGTVGMVGAW